jgi:sugar/nucleoside kinase (ribokinase family)
MAARFAEEADLGVAMQWANAAAALSTERPGAVPSMPTRDEIATAMRGA